MNRKDKKLFKKNKQTKEIGKYNYETGRSNLMYSPETYKWDILKNITINNCKQTFSPDSTEDIKKKFKKNPKKYNERCKILINNLIKRKMLPDVKVFFNYRKEEDGIIARIVDNAAEDINKYPLFSIKEYASNECNKYKKNEINPCKDGVNDAYDDDIEPNDLKQNLFYKESKILVKDINKKYHYRYIKH
jgi:hypothetical protein